MKNLDEIFRLQPSEFDNHWGEMDAIIQKLSTLKEQQVAWKRVADYLNSSNISKGHPFSRLGVLHLLTDTSETQAFSYLENAYKEDDRFWHRVQTPPHRRGAYRLLSLVKDFLTYLQEQHNWEKEQLRQPHRAVLVTTLLLIYDKSLIQIWDTPVFTYPVFSKLIQDDGLSRFAKENYYCAVDLLEMFFLKNQHFNKHANEYPLARAIVGLLGGVLEAILTDRLPHLQGKPLGVLIERAHQEGTIRTGTRLAALSTLMNYLRKHIHPDRETRWKEYFVDINVAKGCKDALDGVIGELLQSQSEQPTPTNSEA